MRILITGGAGFIGSHVVDRCVEAGHLVRVVDLLHPAAHDGKPDYLNDGAEYIWGDLRDEAIARRAVQGVDAVSHQASMVGLGKDFDDVVDYVGHNDLGTAALLRALYQARREIVLVVASSMVVYGEGAYSCPEHGATRPLPRSQDSLRAGNFAALCPECAQELTPEAIDESAAPDPRNVYAATKLHQEHLAQAFATETGTPVVRLRYHNVYGSRMPAQTPYAGVASIFRSALERGEPPRIFEDGDQLRDFVHVEDVARANELAFSATSGAFNVCSGEPHSILQMARALSGAYDHPLDPQITGEYRIGDVRHVFSSPEKARDSLGFSAEITFAKGISNFASEKLRRPPG